MKQLEHTATGKPLCADQINIDRRSVRDGFLTLDLSDDLRLANPAVLGRKLACQASALVGEGRLYL